MSISKYKVAFAAGFVLVPSAIWAFEVSPTLHARDAYLKRQENAMEVQERNRMLPTQRDELRQRWTTFKPVADEALADIGNDLNPHLVQKRMNDLAAATGCKVIIQPMTQKDSEASARFTLAGEGTFQALVKFIDQLEQGQHFVRFEKLTLGLPDRSRDPNGDVRLTATVTIPVMPKGVSEATSEAINEEGN